MNQKAQTTGYSKEHAYRKKNTDRKVQMTIISEMQDQNVVLHTETKQASHHEKTVRERRNNILNKIFIQRKSKKTQKTRLKTTHATKTN